MQSRRKGHCLQNFSVLWRIIKIPTCLEYLQFSSSTVLEKVINKAH
ncbi:hypothetical protein Nmel_004796 [Mimus melanotis]